MSSLLTVRQKKMLHTKTRRINLLIGSVRSGKTWISLVMWCLFVASMPKDVEFLMVGRTITTLQRNCLVLLAKLEPSFTYNLTGKVAFLYGHTIWLEGANDERAYTKINGSTLGGVYIDELTLIPESFYLMCLSRMSVLGAKLFATTNPDTPKHYVNQTIILNEEIDSLVSNFLISDNTFLDPFYVEQLAKEYTGVYYDRYFLGLWVAAEGIIYRSFADNPNRFIMNEPIDPRQFAFCTVGVDFGGSESAHAFQLTGFYPGFKGIITLDEVLTKDAHEPQILTDLFVEFIKKNKAAGYFINECFADSAEQILIGGLRKGLQQAKIVLPVRNAKKGSVNDRIRFYATLMGAGKYKIMPHCVNTVDAFANALWDKKKSEKLDTRLDNGTTNIDTLDAQEYSTERFQKRLMASIMTGEKAV